LNNVELYEKTGLAFRWSHPPNNRERRFMSISLKTHKMLWGRAACRCSLSNCRKELIEDATVADEESVIGEAAHIIAKEPSGPRGDSNLNEKQKDSYQNLILLCKEHHKLADDQCNTYTVKTLKEMKEAHEQWVRRSLGSFDAVQQRDDEIYAAYIDQWAILADLDNWLDWSTWILGGLQQMHAYRDRQLSELRKWLFSRVWPKRYLELEAAFENFSHVLQDFQNAFHQHSQEKGSDIIMTQRFYKIEGWNKALYDKLLVEYEFHVALVDDLFLELTRAVNYIGDQVRHFISRLFRLQEGLVLVETGTCEDLSIRRYRVEYHGTERVLYPYPGLDQFKRVRKTRDVFFGAGVNSDDPEFRELLTKRSRLPHGLPDSDTSGQGISEP
jgi:hypothetical protein